jgi:hypothetical protein
VPDDGDPGSYSGPWPGPSQARAHEELHSMVTAYLGGDLVNTQALITQTPSPRAVILAAVREMGVAVHTIGQLTGEDTEVVWRRICEAWASGPGRHHG